MHDMTTKPERSGPGPGMVVSAVLAAGVLAGCEYCQPLLLGMVTYQLLSSVVARFSHDEESGDHGYSHQ